MNSNRNPQLRLVEVHGQKLTVTSLVIAESFGRVHKDVLKSLDKLLVKGTFNQREIAPTSYLDIQGKANRMYVLDERSFLIAMPFIGGKKSTEGQVALVDEFLRIRQRLNEPRREQEIQYKRDMHTLMMDSLLFGRKLLGKATRNVHFMSENFFCNRALTGVWQSLEESELDLYDVRLLRAIRERNTLLIAHFPQQSDRKKRLNEFVTEYRGKHPRLEVCYD